MILCDVPHTRLSRCFLPQDALNNLGNLFLRMGQPKEAEKRWRRLIQVDPRRAAQFERPLQDPGFPVSEEFRVAVAVAVQQHQQEQRL